MGMMTRSRLRTGLLAGVALVTAGATAHAADLPPNEPVSVGYAVGQKEPEKAIPANLPSGWAIYAAAAAVLAALAHAVGVRRIAAGLKTATAASVKAAGGAAATVGRVLASPIRSASLLVAIGAVALLGVGSHEIEWLAGAAFGAIIAASVLLRVRRARKASAAERRPIRH